MDLKYVMPKKLANIEKFMEEFFLTTRNSDLFKLNEPTKEFKYFNYYIIKIINSMPADLLKTSFQNIFEYINDKIKNKYKEEIENNKKKIRKMFRINNISDDIDKINEQSNKNTINIKKSKINHDSSSIDSIDKIFSIDKQFLYNELFPNTSIKFSTIQNNFSTIKSNNKNIINILRESDSSINNNNNFLRQKNTDIKEENNLIKSNIKTISLISESNLISKDDVITEKDISNDFSLVSAIKKNENNNLFKLKFIKNENTNLKNVNLQDLLNTSNTIKNTNTKGKIRNTEESVSDLINVDYNKDYNSTSNIIRKKNIKIKKGKQRTKLAFFDNDN